ncbi:hypothetical protein VFPPC_18396 [Pochonia chlamydosporia 170]|uniref:Uncharacterized protein n=1 Tax=Pochonia chlamydosporia 170 TaxID=1380566 RepID=A0A219APG6_METCM|nr:hypothetical protein VFPPC_18396 [Pochonia chlamydosporia 170]OWT42489.1 hypothetical protein VFPPC_18396 [Pochonia chlamydosporia 170]
MRFVSELPYFRYREVSTLYSRLQRRLKHHELETVHANVKGQIRQKENGISNRSAANRVLHVCPSDDCNGPDSSFDRLHDLIRHYGKRR